MIRPPAVCATLAAMQGAPATAAHALDVDATLRTALASIDLGAARRTWRSQDQLIFARDVFPSALVEAWRDEASAVADVVVRNHMPFVRKGGYVGYDVLRDRCPTIVGTYRSPAMIELIAGLAGRPLQVKPDADDHACAIHDYRDPGDFIGWHYDTCGARQHTSYTALIGLVDRSRMRLDCRLHRRSWLRRTVRLPVATAPGSLLAFSGTTIWHRLTPMGPGEERIVLSFAYRTEYQIAGMRWLRERVKDAMVYDGVRAIRDAIGARRARRRSAR